MFKGLERKEKNFFISINPTNLIFFDLIYTDFWYGVMINAEQKHIDLFSPLSIGLLF